LAAGDVYIMTLVFSIESEGDGGLLFVVIESGETGSLFAASLSQDSSLVLNLDNFDGRCLVHPLHRNLFFHFC